MKVSFRSAAVAAGLFVCALSLYVSAAPPATPAASRSAEESKVIRRRSPIVEAVAKVRPGVVSLQVTRTDDYGSRRDIQGTGIVVDERGYILTNRHVAGGAERITATLSDGTKYDARVQFTDPKTDLAIIRVDATKKLPSLSFGPGHDLMLGETILAIGNPYGFDGTVTTGIISGLNREIEINGEKLTRIVQTNAAINPGNSGGPLININGEVIGVVVAIREGAQCLAFAINAETAKAWLAKHLSASKVSKVEHGLTTTESATEEGKDRQKVVVEAVAGGSTAARLGLRKGDVIVKIGALKISNRFDVERALWGFKPGDRIETAVVREGRTMTVALPVGGADTMTASR
jgi:serine protease Do